MKQLKAEVYKLKYSKASKWLIVFMVLLFSIPFIVGNNTLFMTFGDYRNLDSIGWICYIADFQNVQFKEVARYALSINFFVWLGLIGYIISMIGIEYQFGTLKLPVIYGVNKTKILANKLFILNLYFFCLYLIVEISLLCGLSLKYNFMFTLDEFFQFIFVVILNIFALIGIEIFSVVFMIMVKNIGVVSIGSCIYFFSGAITYPMVFTNFDNQSLLVKIFCLLNPTTYMYNIGGFQISKKLISGTVLYGVFFCIIGMVILHFLLEKQEF